MASMKEKVVQYLKHPELMDETTLLPLKELIEYFPYFQTARILYLKNLHNINSYKFDAELKKHAVYISNRKHLYQFLIQPIKQKKDEFELLPINEESFEDKLPFNFSLPSSEYKLEPTNTELEVTIEVDEKNKQNELINRFIETNPSIKPITSNIGKAQKATREQEKEAKDNIITDTLAKIYIQQKHYEKAIDSYKKLILKFPEKNAYFASQIEKINQLMSKE